MTSESMLFREELYTHINVVNKSTYQCMLP